MGRDISHNTTKKILAGVCVLALLMAWPLVATSGDGDRSADEVSRITQRVSQGLYSPYCPGQTLAMCPSTQASVARQDIQKMARDGKDADEIKEDMLERYGDDYELVEPSDRDQSMLLGGIVGGLVVAALAVGWLARRRLTGAEENGGAGESAMDHADIDADDEELYLEELRAEYDDWS